VIADERPGVLSRFTAWVDHLPGRGWWVYPLLYALLFAWSHGVLWATHVLSIGEIQPFLTVSAFYAPYLLAAMAVITRVSERALSAFWPATGLSEEARDAWRSRFVNSPHGLGLPALVIGLAVATIAFLSASEANLGWSGDRLIFYIAYMPAAAIGYATVPLLLGHTVYQLRQVAREHREATAIDPFDREPLYAFSLVTALNGLAYVLLVYFTLIFNSAFQQGNAVSLVALATVFVIGIACFVLPLWGIHDRLVDEKAALLREVETRVTLLGAELYRRVDAGEFDGTKTITDALAGIAEIRKRIADVPTWPWRPQVLSGFLSALLIPVVVYLVTRAISSQLGQ
jgi:hypothetical protein